MRKHDIISAIEKNFAMLAAVLLTGILFAEAALLSVYSGTYTAKKEAAVRLAAENRRMGIEHLLEQLEAEIDFVIRQDSEESLQAARRRVESFADAVAGTRKTSGSEDDSALFEYLKTANISSGGEYIYVLNSDRKLIEHPLKHRLKRVIHSDGVEKLRKTMTEMPPESSAAVSYRIFTADGALREKTAYIKKTAPDGMIIGSGFCNDKSREKIQNYIISQLAGLRENDNTIGYFAVIEKNGNILKALHTEGDIRTDSGYLQKLASRLGDAKNSFFYEISDDGGIKKLRMTALRNIPAWNWVVAAGLDEPAAEAAEKSVIRDLRLRFCAYAAVSALAALLLMFITLSITGRRKRLMLEAVENACKKAEERTEELRQLGRRLTSEHMSVIGTERRLKEIKENLEKTVEDRVRDLKDISVHLRKENMKIIKVNEELIAARKKANEASMVKTEFLANMSHEIRTPIHAILSYSSFGLKKFENIKDIRQKHYFGKISESADRLLSFINDLIDLSDLESGRMKYKISGCQVTGLLRTAVKELERILLEKKITVIVPDSEAVICGDAAKLRQVFLNIYSNAAKFSPPDSLIKTEIIPENSFLKIVITDFGPGVDESEKLLIFEKFTQSSKTKTGAGGIGLGLAICREIVTDHGGRIYVTDNPEGGSRFTVELPLF
ncbi:hypothetical protein EP073_10945 [Geovibrio thiophilus]|uniref:histidine kinase n=1 Tax=Geovibrio thiophilus TaxID=139438 RepID=A0A410K0F9_9BACT|nr:ATP-binding protein [Geovibrio thiophilus]QAR33900.1 hypothetical protein EP073_10945 [Geovibrio thiophilus]